MVSDKVDFLAGNCMGAMPGAKTFRKKLDVIKTRDQWRQLRYNFAYNVTGLGEVPE